MSCIDRYARSSIASVSVYSHTALPDKGERTVSGSQQAGRCAPLGTIDDNCCIYIRLDWVNMSLTVRLFTAL